MPYTILSYAVKFTSKRHSQTTPTSEWRYPGSGNVSRTLC